MLHQIALFQKIPALRQMIRGFEEETRVRLVDCSKTDYRLRGKYTNRLELAEKALKALRELHACLDE